MSGGVDSAVAAARAVEAGHDVIGVHLALSSNPQKYRSGARGCCTVEDSHDARRAADVIGIQIGNSQQLQRGTPLPYPRYKTEYQLHLLRDGHHVNPQLCNNHVRLIDTFVDY